MDPFSIRRYLPVSCRLVIPQQRENLLYVRCGNSSKIFEWFDEKKERNWDLMLSYFEVPNEPKKYANYTSIGGLSKFSSVKDIHEDNPDLFTKYKFIGVIDDDLFFKFSDIDVIFDICSRCDLDIAQPSFSENSFVSYLFKNVTDSAIRFTNFIEVMAPFFSNSAFKKCVPTFNKSISTWGLDQLWPFLLGYPENKLAIIDYVCADHLKPIDTENGNFYKFLSTLSIDPHAEGRSVWDYYNFIPQDHKIYMQLTEVEFSKRFGTIIK